MITIKKFYDILNKAGTINDWKILPKSALDFLQNLRTKFQPIVELDNLQKIVGFETLLIDKDENNFGQIESEFKSLFKERYNPSDILKLLDIASIVLHEYSIAEFKNRLIMSGKTHNLFFSINIDKDTIEDTVLMNVIDECISNDIIFELSEKTEFYKIHGLVLPKNRDCFLDDLFSKNPAKFVLRQIKDNKVIIDIKGLKYDYESFQRTDIKDFKSDLNEIFKLYKSYYVIIEGVETKNHINFIERAVSSKTRKIYIQGKYIKITGEFKDILIQIKPFGYILKEKEVLPLIPERVLLTENLAQRNDFKKASKFRLVIFKDFKNLKDIIDNYCGIKTEVLSSLGNSLLREHIEIVAFSLQYPDNFNDNELQVLRTHLSTCKETSMFVILPYAEDMEFNCLRLGYNNEKKRCYLECNKEKCGKHEEVENNNKELLDMVKFYWENGYFQPDYEIPIYKPSVLIEILKWIYGYYLPFSKSIRQLEDSLEFSSLVIRGG